MICYYGHHYFAFFYSTAHAFWLLFDDIRVVNVGTWSQVVDKYVMSHLSSLVSCPWRKKMEIHFSQTYVSLSVSLH